MKHSKDRIGSNADTHATSVPTGCRRGAAWRKGVGCAGVGMGLFLGYAAWGAEAVVPWRLGTTLRLPDWMEVSGEHRSRYETLDGQFRLGREGSDQAYALRTTLLSQFKAEPGRAVIEVMDSRQYLSDAGSPIDTTMVNAIDVLQAYARWDAGDLIPGGTNTVRIGRETLDLGNRRLVARNAYRNTINAFTGLDWLWEAEGGGWVRAFYFLPVRRLPEDRTSLLDNDVVLDSQSFDAQFGGAYGEVPGMPWGTRLEVYYLYLHDEATPRTRDRDLHTPGWRWYREAKPGRWDFEVESTFQAGTSQERLGPTVPVADHFAIHQHGAVGYTFDHRWRPRIGVRYDYASGDSKSGDSENGRFDTLYGARRFEFGPTGIYGAVARANLNSPEYHFSVRPIPSVEVGVSHRFVWLAESRDAWTPSGLVDPTGRSGSEIGQQVEFRVRWNALPGNLRFDTGYTHLFAGDFIGAAPGSAAKGDVEYAYFEATLQF
ncbi:MAG: alginate export family protein [Verrucomicrobiales bacterium]|nr:alginate export family protein [Verrucomicrobiales bacterium]